MYLTRLELNPAHLQAGRDLKTVKDMHRTLSRAIPEEWRRAEEDNRERPVEARLLFRVHGATARRRPFVLVQTGFEPDWGFLDEPTWAGYAADLQVKELKLDLEAGQVVSVFGRFNITRRDAHTRSRVPVRDADKQVQWLARQGLGRGFYLLDAQQVGSGVEAIGKPNKRRERREGEKPRVVMVPWAELDALVRVTNPAVFRRAVLDGLGREKAFGFGMLSVTAPRSVARAA